ncbi:MAG TPA: DUF2071 domain-containing protein [Chthoniobacteraceae bacterium]|jgi:hypothetical protein|nr:DUF2071 domain-containing protein [Chthoniobacteraceae bacterium]
MAGPLFHADWVEAIFLHYEVEPAALQPLTPFPLDLRDGKAWVSLVHFFLRGMRWHSLPWLGKWIMRPLSDHPFLNVRTYVRHGGETGIYFLSEWLPNRLAIPLGRPIFGLPYYFGRFHGRHDPARGRVGATISGAPGVLRYRGKIDGAPPAPCRPGSLDEFLLERYTAFTQWRGVRRFFRIWHEPWPAVPLIAEIELDSLLHGNGSWAGAARYHGAHYSSGVADVWMGQPQIL